MSNPTTKTANNREENRYLFHWPVALVFDNTESQETFHGRTHDVSLSGCSILTEHNVFSKSTVTVLLSLPADHAGGHRPVIEVKARMVYTLLASGNQKFRCGIEFINFKGSSQAALKKVIDERGIKVQIAGV